MSVACKDMGMNCSWVGKGKTIDDLVAQSKNHVKESHKEYWRDTMSKMSDAEIKKATEPFVKTA